MKSMIQLPDCNAAVTKGPSIKNICRDGGRGSVKCGEGVKNGSFLRTPNEYLN